MQVTGYEKDAFLFFAQFSLFDAEHHTKTQRMKQLLEYSVPFFVILLTQLVVVLIHKNKDKLKNSLRMSLDCLIVHFVTR